MRWSATTMDPKWNPIWYAADHNDSIVQIPGRLWSVKIDGQVSESKIDHDILPYYPMSSAHVFWKGIHYLNTRYINYHVCSDGYYWWPASENRIIRSKNILSVLDPVNLSPKSYVEMGTEALGLESFKGRFSEGIEDIRLFVDPVVESIRFIGSTLEYSPSGKIRMILGEYNVENQILKNGRILEPPTDTHCEKNWIPIMNTHHELFFIYKWHPLQIGKVLDDNRLEIQKTYDTSTIVFGKIRGSSCFIEDTIEGKEGYVGVVHFSEEWYPRQYFHRLVLLEKDSFKPLKYTDPFYFDHLGVEFCIGFAKKEEDYVFWTSKWDRDPSMITANRFACPRWNSCGRWGV